MYLFHYLLYSGQIAVFPKCFMVKPRGTLTLHLVNRDKFNPIVNTADVLMMVSPQKYAKDRINNSIIKFKI